ncbi:hypothetical protein NDU88_010117 [Pleurodeles waltl]|uniref:Uncharacterized protein n=1 Tax=Pleurodeles waltl TaxID=8319 RepID=A0AAV7RYL1_PLEWA|nr:hypothetical protein NDU88_010117 [Pleurodeles waltl]
MAAKYECPAGAPPSDGTATRIGNRNTPPEGVGGCPGSLGCFVDRLVAQKGDAGPCGARSCRPPRAAAGAASKWQPRDSHSPQGKRRRRGRSFCIGSPATALLGETAAPH